MNGLHLTRLQSYRLLLRCVVGHPSSAFVYATGTPKQTELVELDSCVSLFKDYISRRKRNDHHTSAAATAHTKTHQDSERQREYAEVCVAMPWPQASPALTPAAAHSQIVEPAIAVVVP